MTKMTKLCGAVLAATMLMPAAAFAQDVPPALQISGNATVVSDYRFRGMSLSDRDATIQSGISAAHESGFYVGTWGSGLAGYGSFGGSNTELDLYAGYSGEVSSGVTVDMGVFWYMYPGTSTTDFFEPYVSISGALGPATAKLGLSYAPDQDAIGGKDNVYVSADLSAGIPDTPLTLKAHYGYSDGSLAGPKGSYSDWSLGAEVNWNVLTLGVAYVDTSISKGDDFVMSPGRRIAGSGVVFSLGASF